MPVRFGSRTAQKVSAKRLSPFNGGSFARSPLGAESLFSIMLDWSIDCMQTDWVDRVERRYLKKCDLPRFPCVTIDVGIAEKNQYDVWAKFDCGSGRS
jgi:hypothetical protein